MTKWLTDTTISGPARNPRVERGSAPGRCILCAAPRTASSQIRLPLKTEDDHSYFFTWDAYWTDSFLGAGNFNHKAFQFSSGSQDGDAIFLRARCLLPERPRCSCWSVRRAYRGVFRALVNKMGGLANWMLTDGAASDPTAQAQQPLGPTSKFLLRAQPVGPVLREPQAACQRL